MTARQRKRTRHGAKAAPQPPPPDPKQERVEAEAEELAVLWRAMPTALERDSAGTLNSDRHATGAAKGFSASINLDVVDAATRVETGLMDIASQAVRILNLDRDVAHLLLNSPTRVICQLPHWHRSLAGRGQPLAGHISKDLGRWLSDIRAAIGTRRHDRLLGAMCPDHRDDHPTELRVEGAKSQLAPSLLAGPPADRYVLAGPTCSAGNEDEYVCLHVSCSWIRSRIWVPDRGWIQARRLVDKRGRATDWVLTGEDEVCWLAEDGSEALTWRESGAVFCSHCKRTWSTLSERRLLARELVTHGDARPDAAARLIGA